MRGMKERRNRREEGEEVRCEEEDESFCWSYLPCSVLPLHAPPQTTLRAVGGGGGVWVSLIN